MIYSEEDYPQGSDEWKTLKAGKASGSKVADILAKLKSGKPSAGRATYMGQLIAERLTGKPVDTFKNADMERGTEREGAARDLFGAIMEEVSVVNRAVVHVITPPSSLPMRV